MNTASINLQKEDILAILAQNLGYRGSVFPLPNWYLTSWAKGLGLPRGGKTILYTGHMYQLLPVMEILHQQRETISLELLSKLVRMARLVNPFLNTSTLSLVKVGFESRLKYEKCLKDIVFLLRLAGIEPGYLYEAEKYAGALAYDLGLDAPFERHVHRVVRRLRRYGVETIITVDPHTTHVLRHVYPQIIKFDFQVSSYLEVLAAALKDKNLLVIETGRDVVFHDSCVYARYLKVTEQPRFLLKKAGYQIWEPQYSYEATYCCGGPLETLFPEKAREIAKLRVEQLQKTGGHTIVTTCPICLLNLSLAGRASGIKVVDVAQLLAQNIKSKD